MFILGHERQRFSRSVAVIIGVIGHRCWKRRRQCPKINISALEADFENTTAISINWIEMLLFDVKPGKDKILDTLYHQNYLKLPLLQMALLLFWTLS